MLDKDTEFSGTCSLKIPWAIENSRGIRRFPMHVRFNSTNGLFEGGDCDTFFRVCLRVLEKFEKALNSGEISCKLTYDKGNAKVEVAWNGRSFVEFKDTMPTYLNVSHYDNLSGKRQITGFYYHNLDEKNVINWLMSLVKNMVEADIEPQTALIEKINQIMSE